MRKKYNARVGNANHSIGNVMDENDNVIEQRYFITFEFGREDKFSKHVEEQFVNFDPDEFYTGECSLEITEDGVKLFYYTDTNGADMCHNSTRSKDDWTVITVFDNPEFCKKLQNEINNL